MIEDYLVEAMSDDEYISADEFFSSDESMFYDNYVIPEYSEEAGVNVIVPHFDIPTCDTVGELTCLFCILSQMLWLARIATDFSFIQ